MNSLDHVRKIVQEEGRTARNLVQYSLPLEDQNENTSLFLFILLIKLKMTMTFFLFVLHRYKLATASGLFFISRKILPLKRIKR